MAKQKKIRKQLPLVVTGYVLFSLLLISTLISTTIPFGIILFDPRVLHYNVIVTLVALTVGALLPVVVGYSIGDYSVKTKSKLEHHFTGMLFGLLAYWIMILMGTFNLVPMEILQENRNAGLIIANLIPSIGVAIITSIFAIAHVRSRYAKQDVLQYKPFTIVFIASIVALPLCSLVQNVVTSTVGIYSLVPFLLVAAAGLVSYVGLRKLKLRKYDKVVWSAVSVSVLFLAVYVLALFVSSISNYLFPRSTMETQSLISWVGFVIALACWAAYWFKQVKVLR